MQLSVGAGRGAHAAAHRSSSVSRQHRRLSGAAAAARARHVRAAAAAAAPSSNGNGKAPSASPACPSPAETARTVADLSQEAVLCTLTPEAAPLGTPVGYSLDAAGNPLIVVADGSPEAAAIARGGGRCSLLVQPIAYPARGVASVALQGAATPAAAAAAGAAEGDAAADKQVAAAAASLPEGTSLYRLEVDSAVYYGGLDQSAHGLVISGEEYRAAEPDLLRHNAADLINTWNSDRAEDIYRIVASHLGLPLEEMLYAELLWIDRLGIYVRTEALGRNPQVVRVPFYRPVLDERDARSVLTMGSHISWEEDRRRGGAAYVPPPLAPAPASASNN